MDTPAPSSSARDRLTAIRDTLLRLHKTLLESERIPYERAKGRIASSGEFLNLVLNDDTRSFLDAKRIARMKPGALLVNTARGALVDEAALIAALQSGHIRHAGLDVFHNEPLKADHPLARLPNVTLSAHAAFRTLEASMTLLRRAIDIVKAIQR